MNKIRSKIRHPTAIAETTIAETTTIEDKLSEKMTVLEEIELGLFTGFRDTAALENKKSTPCQHLCNFPGYKRPGSNKLQVSY